MPINSLSQLDKCINKLSDIVKSENSDYNIVHYDLEIDISRGEYGFNIMPRNIITREFTGELSLPNIMIDVFCYYILDANEKSNVAWSSFMVKMNDILNKINTKESLPDGVSTVSVDIEFDNPLIDKEKLISLTFKCEYKVFATR